MRVDDEGEDRNVALVQMVEIEILLEGVFLVAVVVVVLHNGLELLHLNFLHIPAVGQVEIVVVAVVLVLVVVVVVVVEDPC